LVRLGKCPVEHSPTTAGSLVRNNVNREGAPA